MDFSSLARGLILVMCISAQGCGSEPLGEVPADFEAGSSDASAGGDGGSGAGGVGGDGGSGVGGDGGTTPDVTSNMDWSVADLGSGSEALVHIPSLPASQVTKIEYRVDTGVYQPLYGTVMGTYRVGNLAANAPLSIQLRFRSNTSNTVTNPRVITLRAKSSTFLTAFSDQLLIHDFGTEEFDRFGPTDATSLKVAENDAPVKWASGAEVQLVSGPNSIFVRSTFDEADKAEKTINRLFYDGLGAHDDLAPIQSRTETVWLAKGNTKTQYTIQVLGRASLTTQRAVSVVGFDNEGNPVPFRFDRVRQVGRHRDGRPFVVGPVGILSNANAPRIIEADPVVGLTVVERYGAKLDVVKHAGLVSGSENAPVKLGDDAVYTLKAPATSFSGWDESAASAAGPANLELVPTFETIGVHFASTNTAPVEVRFKKLGQNTFFPSRNLIYDHRPIPDDSQAFGKHRNVLLYLEPGAEYEVQVKQGNTYARKTAKTKSFATAKTQAPDSAYTLDDGYLVINVGGTAAQPVEYHSRTIIGGGIVVNAPHVIVRNMRVLGATNDAIELGPDATDVRIIGNEIRGWAAPQTDQGGYTWARNNAAAVRLKVALGEVLVMGNLVGSPRLAANIWEEKNGNVSSYADCIYGDHCHPWGAGFITQNSSRGRNVVVDNSVDVDSYRNLNDAMINNGADGLGPHAVVAYNYFHGWSDDGIEMEGSHVNSVVAHNTFHARPVRKVGSSPKSMIGLAAVRVGPLTSVRNYFFFDKQETFANEKNTYIYKIGAGGLTSYAPLVSQSRLQMFHETVGLGEAVFPMYMAMVNDAKKENIEVIDCIVLHKNAAAAVNPTAQLNISESNAFFQTASSFPSLVPETMYFQGPPASIVNKGVRLFNVNDAGPFGSATPDYGAVEH